MNRIMGISRLRTGTDGKGITTLVTFCECPLKCKYCINDVSHEANRKAIEYTPAELLDIVMIDDIYFKMSDGGITFGGGEPLLNSLFIKDFAIKAPKEWKIRIETSLNVPWVMVETLIPYIDQWIIDIKDMNDEIYKEYTGTSNKSMIYNIRKLMDIVPPERLYLRFPNIPGFNTSEDVEKSLSAFKDIDCKKEVFEYVFINDLNNLNCNEYIRC